MPLSVSVSVSLGLAILLSANTPPACPPLYTSRGQVLWEGNRWKPVSMGDIIQSSKVKLSYRKAMLLVHPDKCGSLGPEERLIAKRVFEAVNEAYTLFQEKEMS